MDTQDRIRYNLNLPTALYAELQATASDRGITVAELLRKFVKLGMLATALESTPEAKLIIRTATSERELVLV